MTDGESRKKRANIHLIMLTCTHEELDELTRHGTYASSDEEAKKKNQLSITFRNLFIFCYILSLISWWTVSRRMSEGVLDVCDPDSSVLHALIQIVQDMASLQPICVGRFFNQLLIHKQKNIHYFTQCHLTQNQAKLVREIDN